MPSLASLAVAAVAGSLTIEDAERLLRDTGLDQDDLVALLQGLDRAMGSPTAEQVTAARIAYQVSDLVDDRRLRVILAASWGRLLMYGGDLEAAAVVVREAETRSLDVADMRLRTMVASLRASVAMLADDEATAIEARRQAVRLAREVGDQRLEVAELTSLASQLAETDADAAGEHLRRAIDSARHGGLHDLEAQASYLRARLAEGRGDRTTAIESLEAATGAALAATNESLELLQTVGRIVNMQYQLGHPYRFEAMLHLGERLSRRFGAVDAQIRYLSNLGLTAAANDDPEAADRYLGQARELAVRSGDEQALASVDEDLARVGGRTTQRPRSVQSSDRTPGVADRVAALADEVTAGRLDINEAISRLPAVGRADDPTATVHSLVDLASDAAEGRGQWAYAVATLTLFWMPEEVADSARYQLLMLWGTFAMHAFALGDAMWAFDQAAEVATRMGEPNAIVVALTNAGTALRRGGRSAEAAAVYSRAVELAATCGPEALAGAALNAGTAYGDLRRYAQARQLYETALAIYERDPRERAAELATALLNHGETLVRLGDPAGGERQLLRALRLQRERGLTGQEGVTLGLLGQIRINQGDTAGGLSYLQRALEVAEAEPDRWNAALWALDLASVCAAFGMEDVAAGFYQRALEHSAVTGDHRTATKARLGLVATGDPGGRRGAVRELLRHWRDYAGRDSVVAARTALRLAAEYAATAVGMPDAIAAAERGDFGALRGSARRHDAAALREAHRWLDRARRALVRVPHQDSLVIDEAMQRAGLHRVAGRPRTAIRALTRARRTARAVAPTFASPDGPIARTLIALLHQDLGNPRAARRHIDAAIDAREAGAIDITSGVLRTAFRRQTATLYQRGVDCAMRTGDIDGAYRYAERSKNIEGRRALLFRREGVRLEPPSPDQLRALAGELGNAVVVEFMPTGTAVYAFLFAPSIPHGQAVVELDAFGLAELTQRVWQPLQLAYERLKRPASAFDPAASRDWRRAVVTACAETGRLMEPIARRLSGHDVDAVIFVPHSVLHCLPLHACPIDGDDLWGDRYRVSYAPSAAILAAAAHAPRAEEDFAAFANPTSDLPFSEMEVAAASAGRTDVRTATGVRATPTALLEALQTASNLHLACHATHGMDSSLLMAPGGDEGRVSLAHIQRDVTLRPGARVYLSACETGTVTPQVDDEFTSLAGGMLFAGAASVVATHWRVRDACALIVADLFYSTAGLSISDAERLRRAVRRARTMSEKAVLERLVALYSTHPRVDETRWTWLLKPFNGARTDVRPFSEPADWAAFFLAGRP